MSFAEFTYPLMQAYDWWVLYQKGVQIQVGGADQFGNILAGAETIKNVAKADPATIEEIYFPRPRQKDANKNPLNISNDPMGFTTPLLTTSSGEKFGKSAGNAVWLDPDMTSSFDLYQVRDVKLFAAPTFADVLQFFLRLPDADVERYLKLLTFVPNTQIDTVMKQHAEDQSKRVAQHLLAKEFVELAHGLAAADQAEKEHRSLFKKDLSLADIKAVAVQQEPSSGFENRRETWINPAVNKYAAPATLESNLSTKLKLPRSLVYGHPLARILWHAGLVASKSEGQRLMSNRGVSIGSASEGMGRKMQDKFSFSPATSTQASDVEQYLVEGLLIVRIGKWKMRIIEVIEDEEFADLGLSCNGWGEPSEAGPGVAMEEPRVHDFRPLQAASNS